jgi:hypothetical protein
MAGKACAYCDKPAPGLHIEPCTLAFCQKPGHTACQHIHGWVCPEEECLKVIDIPEHEVSLRRTAVTSHRKSHGLGPLPSNHQKQGQKRSGGGGSVGKGLIDSIGDAISDVIDGILN